MWQVDRKKIGFTDTSWEANLELEGFLERPASMKEVIEKKLTLTGAQSFQLHYNLMKSCEATKPLTIKVFPESIALKDRARKSAVVGFEAVLPLVVEGRREMMAQLEKRFFTVPPSEPRLVQIWMSKQVPATRVLPSAWHVTAEAHYLTWLRECAIIAGRGERASPPRKAKKKARTSNGFFDNCIGDDDPDPIEVGAGSDTVALEIAKWKVLPAETVGKYKDVNGLVDEFALLFSLREQFPLHFLLFKRLAADLPHEANAESTLHFLSFWEAFQRQHPHFTWWAVHICTHQQEPRSLRAEA